MNRLIQAALRNPHAVTVAMLTTVVLGALCLTKIPIDILPIFNSPAVQVLTFSGGMPANNIEKDITNRMERWTGQAAGTARQESRSIVGASIIRNYYRNDVDPNGALTQVNSLASAAIPNLPPGTLPPVILPFDPTGTTPACLIALDSPAQPEAILYDVGRYEVRNMTMAVPGAVAPVVYGGKIRAIMVYLDRIKMQARNLSPLDAMKALDAQNIFLPTGDAKFGDADYAIDSNSMYAVVKDMENIPLRARHGNATYLRDVATPSDSSFIQTNVVRVNGRRQVYIPVYRQAGSSTLRLVDALKRDLPQMQARLSRPNINLKLVMDQSVYVRHSIRSLVEEAGLGALLCSLVVLAFLGEWRMTVIALMTIPIAVLAALIGLYYTGNTINVMTLSGLSLAIGPLVDVAIVCLENTHRRLHLGATPSDAAYLGSQEVAMPLLVASICTLLVLAPLGAMPGLGQFLFKPMALAVAFAMVAAYLLSLTLVPVRCAAWLRPGATAGGPHDLLASALPVDEGRAVALVAMPKGPRRKTPLAAGTDWYLRCLRAAIAHRGAVVAGALLLLVVVVGGLGPQLRREFFPEVDGGAFEIYLRAPTATRIDGPHGAEARVAAVEQFVREQLGNDIEIVISEIGVTPDWSAAYTPNSGPMDGVIKIQLTEYRRRTAQECVSLVRERLAADHRFADLEATFDAGGMIRGAMNEGKSTPINVRIEAKDQRQAHQIAARISARVRNVPGIVDCRTLQRLDYPQYVIEVDRAKAADLGLNQAEVMQNLVAAMNSSIQFNKKNFWIDPVSANQYFVGVQYQEDAIQSIDALLDVPITGPSQRQAIPLRTLARVRRKTVPSEVTHSNLQPTIDVTMGVQKRDLGHVAADVAEALGEFGSMLPGGDWIPFNPDAPAQTLLGGRITLSGEYSRMQETFRNLGLGLLLATLFVYFLMVALFKSYVLPLVILFSVPLGIVGVVAMLYCSGTAVNVQSLLGVIFMVGIVVSNTVLLVDFAEQLRVQKGLTAAAAVQEAAAIRLRPVLMTALATFFALLPMAIGYARGSEANAPLGRAVIGGLLAGLATTLFVVPSLYSLVVRAAPGAAPQQTPEQDKFIKRGLAAST